MPLPRWRWRRPSANGQPHHRDHRPLKIVIETVDHQRYPTAGDWQLKPDGLHILLSRMSDRRYEFLVGMHEAIEAYLCKLPASHRRSWIDLTKRTSANASQATTATRETTPRRPTTKSICSLPDQLGVNWSAYDREVSSK